MQSIFNITLDFRLIGMSLDNIYFPKKIFRFNPIDKKEYGLILLKNMPLWFLDMVDSLTLKIYFKS